VVPLWMHVTRACSARAFSSKRVGLAQPPRAENAAPTGQKVCDTYAELMDFAYLGLRSRKQKEPPSTHMDGGKTLEGIPRVLLCPAYDCTPSASCGAIFCSCSGTGGIVGLMRRIAAIRSAIASRLAAATPGFSPTEASVLGNERT